MTANGPSTELSREQLATIEMIEAAQLLDKVRKDHNGIMAVFVYLGHDGDNVVNFGTEQGEQGHGCSGKSLLHAIHLAISDWRYRQLTGPYTSSNVAVDEAIDAAIKSFGPGDEIFNTAQFQCAVNARGGYYGCELGDQQCLSILLTKKSIVQLRGGSHWLRLPSGYTRYELMDEAVNCTSDR